MAPAIINEYTLLLNKKANIESALAALPQGYISKKTINEKQYNYLQMRIHGRVKSTYLKSTEVETVQKKLLLRNKYESELPRIIARLSELEKGAKLIDTALAQRMEQLKISVGMDELSQGMKQLCVSFSEAMTSIEGVSASLEAKKDLNNWVNGKISFLSAFENTLKRYGFTVEDD